MANAVHHTTQLTNAFVREADRLKEAGENATGVLASLAASLKDAGLGAQTLIAEDGLQKVAFVGYSMGGNLVLKLLGEWGREAPKEVKAGVGVSPAADLAQSADALHEPLNRIYEWKFLNGLRRRTRRKARPCGAPT